MRNIKIIVYGTVIFLLVVSAPLKAQQSTDINAEKWRILDEDLRQVIIEEFTARRGLDSDVGSLDDLIKTAEEIKEVLRISCDLVGACESENDRTRLGEQLGSFPEYDEQQGMRNAALILGQKYDVER